MKKTIQTLGLLLAAGVLLVSRAPAAQTPAADSATSSAKFNSKLNDLFPDTLVVKGKGIEIKRSTFDDTVTSIKASAAANNQPIPPESMALVERQVLENLIRVQLLLAKATDDDKTKGKDTCSKRFEEMRKKAGSEDTLNRKLKSIGTTQEELRSRWTEECVAEAVLERELKITIPDGDVKKFYDDNPSKFEQPEMVRASHILLSTKDMTTGVELTETQKAAKHKLAEDLLKRARAGDDFAKLAKEYSEDPGSKDTGGEYTFPHGKMVKEFEATAFSLRTNEVSDIVTTQFGYHIIKLSEKIPAKKTPLTEVDSKIKDYLKQQSMQEKLPTYMAQLKKDYAVEILDEKLKPREDLDPALVSPSSSTNDAVKPPSGK
jgi:peptidyl-prolyl cis-trans isomerase C